MANSLQDFVNRIMPILSGNLYQNNQNPDALDDKREARDSKAKPLYAQTVKPYDVGEESHAHGGKEKL